MVKVVETGYPTGLLVEKGNNGKMQYKLDKEQISLQKKVTSVTFWSERKKILAYL